MLISQSLCYLEGREAFKRKQHWFKDNPYPLWSVESFEWQEGWNAEQREYIRLQDQSKSIKDK